MLDAANARRKECVNSLRREKMAEMKAKKRLQAELEQARGTCASTTKASQQVSKKWREASAKLKRAHFTPPSGKNAISYLQKEPGKSAVCVEVVGWTIKPDRSGGIMSFSLTTLAHQTVFVDAVQ